MEVCGIEEAKEDFKSSIAMTLHGGKHTIVSIKAIETVLNELDRLKKYEDIEWQEFNELAVANAELEKKDKVINEMAKYIKQPYRIIAFGSRQPKVEIIKEYFTNKVEREGK